MSKKETTEFSRMPLVQFFKDLFLNDRFFYAMFGMVVLFVLSFIFPSLMQLKKSNLRIRLGLQKEASMFLESCMCMCVVK